MKDIELPAPLPEPDHFAFIDGGNGIYVEGGPTGEPFYSAEQMRDYSRAAVEADRAQRVPDDFLSHKSAWRAALVIAQGFSANEDESAYWSHEIKAFDREYARLLASTPAPAQQETSEGCDPHWSYYFRVTECKAKTSRDGDCICWHTEGTGPFDMVRHDDADQFLEWRESPSSAPETAPLLARIAELDRSLDVMAQNTEAQAHASLQREIELTEKVEKLTLELEEAREALEAARNWIAERPDMRQCSAGKIVSELTRALAIRAAIKEQT